MNRIIRFEQELEKDTPKYKIDSPITDTDTGEDFFENARFWGLKRFLVIELSEWDFSFYIEDRGRLPINDGLRVISIQQARKDIGVYDTKLRIPVPPGMNPHDTYIKVKLLETASRELAESVVWSLFWEMEIEPSYHDPEKSWMYPFAKNHLEHCHGMVRRRHMQAIEKVMEA